MAITIETPRLILRELLPEDAARLNDICNQEHILRWLPGWKTTRRESEAWVGWARLHYKRPGNPPRIMLAITSRETGEMMGLVGAAPVAEGAGEAEVTLFLDEGHLGRGCGSEALEAFCRWALAALGLPWMTAAAEPANHPAVAVLERCGFEKQGFRKSAPGQGAERLIYLFRRYPPSGEKRLSFDGL